MQQLPINGPIDDWTAQRVADALVALDRTQPLAVTINSDGGSVQAGVAIYAQLSTWPGGVQVEITGWALSIASLIAMAGTVRRIHPTGAVMVHAPWIDPGSSNANQLRQRAEVLDTISETMLAAYRRTGQPDDVIRGWLDGQDHWFTAAEAQAAGLMTEIVGEPVQPAAFHNFTVRAAAMPAGLVRSINAMTTAIPDHQAAIQAGIQAEARRRADITRMFKAYASRDGVAELQAVCEADINCTADAAGQKLLAHLGAQCSPIQGAHRARDGGGGDRLADFKAAAQDTLMMRAGLRVSQPHPAVRDLQRYSLVDIAESMLSMTGRTPRASGRDAVIAAALGTSDFPGLLSNVASKALALGYTEAPAGHVLWTGERDLPDFKQGTLANLSEAPSLERVPELTEYRHGALTDSATTFKLDTYGKILRISRQALVNDDLQAFTRLPASMGQAARRLEADLVWGLLTTNPVLSDGQPLFHASHGNLGTATALGTLALSAARAQMRRQKALGGEQFIDPQPAYLVVPVALETQAEQLVASTVDPSRNNDTPQPEFIRRLQVVADPRLDAVSETAWYLAASPTTMDTITRVYLAGQPRPFMEEHPEFEVDALSWKVRLDFGVGAMDFRGLYRNPGIAP